MNIMDIGNDMIVLIFEYDPISFYVFPILSYFRCFFMQILIRLMGFLRFRSFRSL